MQKHTFSLYACCSHEGHRKYLHRGKGVYTGEGPYAVPTKSRLWPAIYMVPSSSSDSKLYEGKHGKGAETHKTVQSMRNVLWKKDYHA